MGYTFTADPGIIQMAEECALRRGTTLEAMIRAYLALFVRRETASIRHEIPSDSVVGSLSGLLDDPGVSDEDLIAESILEKYEALS